MNNKFASDDKYDLFGRTDFSFSKIKEDLGIGKDRHFEINLTCPEFRITTRPDQWQRMAKGHPPV